MCGFSQSIFYYYQNGDNDSSNLAQKTNDSSNQKKQSPISAISTTYPNTENKNLSQVTTAKTKLIQPKKDKTLMENLISLIDPLIRTDCCSFNIRNELGKYLDLYESFPGGSRYVLAKLIGDKKEFLKVKGDNNYDIFIIRSNILQFNVLKRSKHFIILLMALVMVAMLLMSAAMYCVIKGIKERMRSDVEELIASKKNRIIRALQQEVEKQHEQFRKGNVTNLDKISEKPSVDEGSRKTESVIDRNEQLNTMSPTFSRIKSQGLTFKKESFERNQDSFDVIETPKGLKSGEKIVNKQVLVNTPQFKNNKDLKIFNSDKVLRRSHENLDSIDSGKVVDHNSDFKNIQKNLDRNRSSGLLHDDMKGEKGGRKASDDQKIYYSSDPNKKGEKVRRQYSENEKNYYSGDAHEKR